MRLFAIIMCFFISSVTIAAPNANVSIVLTQDSPVLCEELIRHPISSKWPIKEKIQFSHLCFPDSSFDIKNFFISTGD